MPFLLAVGCFWSAIFKSPYVAPPLLMFGIGLVVFAAFAGVADDAFRALNLATSHIAARRAAV